MLPRTLAVILIALFFSSGLKASWEGSGYLKSYAVWQDENSLNNEPLWQSQNSVRLMANVFFENDSSAEIHYEYQPIYQSQAGYGGNSGGIASTVGVTSNRYRYKDLSNDVADDDSRWVQLHNLDRLNYRYSNSHGDLTVGRQVVSFGSARFINPTDIFLPYTLQTLNQEYRVGIDALRYQWALGDFSVLDMGAIVGEDGKKENSALFLRGRENIDGSDIELVMIVQDQSYLLGGGIETALGDFGFWFETAYAYSDSVSEQEPVSYWRHSVGADYALGDNVITMVEYHFNGAGSDSAKEYLLLLQLQPYEKGGVYLLGQHYVIPSISWVMNPLVNFSGSAFFNLSDQSQFFSLAMDVSWSDNLYSDFGTYLSNGDGLKGNPSDPASLELGSEFGEYPFTLYASLRWYF